MLGVQSSGSGAAQRPARRRAYHAAARRSSEDASPLRRLRFSAPIAAVALVYAATLALLPSGGLWIVDNGNKRIQVEALLASGFRDFSLPWPGRDLDPELAFNPLPNAFSVVREGRLYSVFSPVFPALSRAPVPPARRCRPLPAAAARLARAARMRGQDRGSRRASGAGPRARDPDRRPRDPPLVLCRRLLGARRRGEPVRGLGGARARVPGARLAAAALRLSGLAIALAAGMRDPMLLFAAVLGALVFFATPKQRLRTGAVFGAGLAAGLLPLALFQWLALGDPLGFHLTHGFAPRAGEQAGIGFHLRTRSAALYHLFLASGGGALRSALLTRSLRAVAARAAEASEPRLSGRRARRRRLGARRRDRLRRRATSTAASPIEQLLRSNGFFAAAPLLVVGLLRPREAGLTPASDRVVGWLLRLVARLRAAVLRAHAAAQHDRHPLGQPLPARAVSAARGALRRRPVAAVARARCRPVGGRAARAARGGERRAPGLLHRSAATQARVRRAGSSRRCASGPRRSSSPMQWWVPQTLAHEFFGKSIFYVSTLRAGESPARAARAARRRRNSCSSRRTRDGPRILARA